MVGKNPDVAGLVTAHRTDLIRGQAVQSGVSDEPLVITSRDPARLRPCPELSGGRAVKRREAIARNPRGIGPIEHHEAGAVEPHQAVQGGQPEVTIRSLAHVPNDVLRQTVLRRPGVDVVLSNGSR